MGIFKQKPSFQTRDTTHMISGANYAKIPFLILLAMTIRLQEPSPHTNVFPVNSSWEWKNQDSTPQNQEFLQQNWAIISKVNVKGVIQYFQYNMQSHAGGSDTSASLLVEAGVLRVDEPLRLLKSVRQIHYPELLRDKYHKWYWSGLPVLNMVTLCYNLAAYITTNATLLINRKTSYSGNVRSWGLIERALCS